eukprot:6460068-Amphidinium_carterae.1
MQLQDNPPVLCKTSGVGSKTQQTVNPAAGLTSLAVQAVQPLKLAQVLKFISHSMASSKRCLPITHHHQQQHHHDHHLLLINAIPPLQTAYLLTP